MSFTREVHAHRVIFCHSIMEICHHSANAKMDTIYMPTENVTGLIPEDHVVLSYEIVRELRVS